jgi:collagenase-like PrtC family protease
MNFIIIPNSYNMIDSLVDKDCSLLLGIESYSVNTFNVNIDYIKEISKRTNVYVSLNKNIANTELDEVEHILKELNKMDIKGLFFADIGIVNLVHKLNLNINLIWSQEHLTTNFYTINYWYNHGVKGTFLSNEITKDEMLTISNNTDSELYVQLFGYIPMYVSKRHAVNNYLKYFNLSKKDSNYYIFKEDNKYSIVDNNEGTVIYSSFILNGLREYLELNKTINNIILNGYQIDDNQLLEVLDIFNQVNDDNYDSLNNKLTTMFDNLGNGFLNEETIYRVKKNDK